MKLVLLKLVQLVIVLVVVTFLSFSLLQLVPPAGHVERVLVVGDPHDPTVKARQLEVRQRLGLDRSILHQYGHWLNGFVHGDMGSYYGVSGEDPVSKRLWQSVPVSLQLMAYSTVLTLLFSIPLGVWSAFRAGKWFDKITNAGSFAAIAMPNFALGLILSYYVGSKLGWLPPTDYVRFNQGLWPHLKSMVLPTVALSAGQIAIFQRLLRTDMIATLQEDFITVAKSKGISNSRVLWRHALRPSSLTLLTVVGITVGSLIGGAIAVEIVFNLPGMGRMIADAISADQFIALQSAVAVIAIAYVVVNFVVDLFYTVLDPRVRKA